MTGRVVITGAGGFIGSHLTEHLSEGGYDVIGCSRHPHGKEIRVDVTKKNDFKKLPEDPDIVIHLAAITFPPEAEEDFGRAYDVNVLGTYNSLMYFLGTNAKRFVFASSAKAYGTPEYLPVDEKHPLNPDTTYGRTKALSEGIIRALACENPRSYTILRQFNIYGPGQPNMMFIPTLLKQLKEGGKTTLGNLGVRRDFLYVKDAVKAYERVMRSGKKGVETYNVGSGKAVGLSAVVDLSSRILGVNPDIKFDKSKGRVEASEIYCDNTRLKKTGWKQETFLEEGLRMTLEGLNGA